MKHWVVAYRRVPGRLADLRRRLRVEIAQLLRAATDAEDGQMDPDGSMLLRLPGHVVGLDVHKQVRLRTGVALDHGDRTCIPLQWEAEPGRHAFPVFRGTIELEPMSSESAQLTVVGAVTPPLGLVGALAETTALGSIAERTAQHLADRLADAMLAPATGDGDGERPGEPSTVPAAQLTVRDVMTPDPLVLYDDMPVKTAALLLFHFDVSGAPVRTDDGGLVGVLSEADLLSVQAPPPLGFDKRASAARERRFARTVGEACSRPAQVVTPDTTVVEAARVMWDHDIARLIVLAGAEIVGIVSRHDVLRAVVRSDADTQAAIDLALRDLDEETAGPIATQVEWGVVTAAGELTYHSGVQRVLRAIDAVDGVVDVESRLGWHDDDLVPPSIVP